jgi:hypothetical protein
MKYGEHTTFNELKFIDSLSPKLLMKYANSLRLRANWGNIDKKTVVRYVAKRKKKYE